MRACFLGTLELEAALLLHGLHAVVAQPVCADTDSLAATDCVVFRQGGRKHRAGAGAGPGVRAGAEGDPLLLQRSSWESIIFMR